MEGWEIDGLFKEYKKNSETFRSMVTFEIYLKMFKAKNHQEIVKKQKGRRSVAS